MLHCTPRLCTLTDWPSVLRHPTAPLIKQQAGGRSGGSRLQSRPAAPSMCGWSRACKGTLVQRPPWCARGPRSMQPDPAVSSDPALAKDPGSMQRNPRRCAHPLPCPGRGTGSPATGQGRESPPEKPARGSRPGRSREVPTGTPGR